MDGDARRRRLQDRAPAADLHRKDGTDAGPDRRALRPALPGCFTCTRATGGRAWHAERHAERLARDAAQLGVGGFDVGLALRLFAELAAPTRDGGTVLKLRLEATPDAAGAARLRGGATPLEADRLAWRAIVAPAPHPGPSATSSAKSTERAVYEAALAAVSAAGADEALLVDAAGFAVEGARTNLVVACADGRLVTPPLARGAQAGVARALLLERVDALVEADVTRDDLAAAREIVAVNAVRGARAIASIDGGPVGDGEPGPWCETLGRAFASRC